MSVEQQQFTKTIHKLKDIFDLKVRIRKYLFYFIDKKHSYFQVIIILFKRFQKFNTRQEIRTSLHHFM